MRSESRIILSTLLRARLQPPPIALLTHGCLHSAPLVAGVCRGDDELQQNLLPQASDRVRIDCELAHCLVCGLDSLAAASASDEASKARHMAAWIRFQCRSADAKGEQQPTLRQLRLRRAQLQLAIDSGLDTAHTCCAWDSGVEQAALEEYEQTCEADHLEWVAQAYGLPSVEEMQHQLRGAKKRDKGEAEKG